MYLICQVYTTSTSGVLNRETVGMSIDHFFVGEDDDEVKELQAVRRKLTSEQAECVIWPDALQDMLEYIFNKFDTDKDGIISYEEYYEIVSNQPVLLEFLGQIFPDLSDMTVIAYCTNMYTLFPEED